MQSISANPVFLLYFNPRLFALGIAEAHWTELAVCKFVPFARNRLQIASPEAFMSHGDGAEGRIGYAELLHALPKTAEWEVIGEL